MKRATMTIVGAALMLAAGYAQNEPPPTPEVPLARNGTFGWDAPDGTGAPWAGVAMYRITGQEPDRDLDEHLGAVQYPVPDGVEHDQHARIDAVVTEGDRLYVRSWSENGLWSGASNILTIELPTPPDPPQNFRLTIEISTDLQDWQPVGINPDRMFMRARLEPIYPPPHSANHPPDPADLENMRREAAAKAARTRVVPPSRE